MTNVCLIKMLVYHNGKEKWVGVAKYHFETSDLNEIRKQCLHLIDNFRKHNPNIRNASFIAQHRQIRNFA